MIKTDRFEGEETIPLQYLLWSGVGGEVGRGGGVNSDIYIDLKMISYGPSGNINIQFFVLIIFYFYKIMQRLM